MSCVGVCGDTVIIPEPPLQPPLKVLLYTLCVTGRGPSLGARVSVPVRYTSVLFSLGSDS